MTVYNYNRVLPTVSHIILLSPEKHHLRHRGHKAYRVVQKADTLKVHRVSAFLDHPIGLTIVYSSLESPFRLPIRDNRTFFASSYSGDVISRNLSKSAFFAGSGSF